MAAPSARTRPSMADVGVVANVSAQTVSRYFTGGYVSAATRERIESAIESVGYRHNRVARNLRVNSTDTIGVVALGPINYGSASLLTGFSDAAREYGRYLIVAQSNVHEPEEAFREVVRSVENFLSFQVEGIIVVSPFRGIDEILAGFESSVPIITPSDFPGPQKDTVNVDHRSGAERAMDHLIGLGHERILHIAGPRSRNEAVEREEGYLRAMRTAGLAPLPVPECAEWDARSGSRIGDHADITEFTAVFAANDEIALGFMSAMRKRGFTAPRDYSIIGIDDMPESAFFTPPLTTLRIDFEAMGRRAFDALEARLRSEHSQEPIVLESHLIVRESTGAPRAD